MTRIAVVGAGISGLSFAWYLQKLRPEIEIELFEQSDRPGGVIQTFRSDEYLAELGADNIATLVPDGLALIEEMGLRGEFISPNPEHRFAQVAFHGKVYPIPNGFSLMQPTQMAPVLKSPLLSFAGRLRILGEYFVEQRKDTTDESVESFAVRRLGRECFDRLVEPIVGGIFTARAETLSMQSTMQQFVAMEKNHGGLIRAALAKRSSQQPSDTVARKASGARYDQFLAPKQGMDWWMNKLANQLRSKKHYNTKVTTLVNTSTGYHLEGIGVDTDGPSFDHVCLALPSWGASELLKEVNPSASRLLASIPYASSAVAILAVPKSEIRPEAMCFGIVVPKIEHRDSLAISLSSEKYPGRCPEDTVLVRVFMGGAIRPELLEQDDESLLAIARRETAELLGVRSLPRWQKLVRWNQAMPQYLIGHCQRITEIREALGKSPKIHVIGNALDGVGIPQCIRLARETASAIASSVPTA